MLKEYDAMIENSKLDLADKKHLENIWEDTYKYHIIDASTRNRIYSLYCANDFIKFYLKGHRLFNNYSLFMKPTLVGKLQYKSKDNKLITINDLFYYIGEQDTGSNNTISLYNDVKFGTTITEKRIQNGRDLSDLILSNCN